MKPSLKSALIITAGWIALALGVIGIFIPILPTTPFLLLSLFLFTRSSQKMYDRILHHRILGSYVRDYVKHRAIQKKARIRTLILLWLTLLLSIILVDQLTVRILLGVVGLGVSAHVLSLRTIQMADEDLEGEPADSTDTGEDRSSD